MIGAAISSANFLRAFALSKCSFFLLSSMLTIHFEKERKQMNNTNVTLPRMGNTNTLILMVGLPGSGKSTLAKRLVIVDNLTKEESIPILHSSDDIRKELSGDAANQKINRLVFKTLHERVAKDLSVGEDVIVDATNLTVRDRAKYVAIAKNTKNQQGRKPRVVVLVMMTSYAESLRRNNARNRVVPEYAMQRMNERFEFPNVIDEEFESVGVYLENKKGYTINFINF